MAISESDVGRTWVTNVPVAGSGDTFMTAVQVSIAAWRVFLEDKGLDLHLSRVIHARQAFEFSSDFPSDIELHATLTLENVVVRKGREIVTVALSATTADAGDTAHTADTVGETNTADTARTANTAAGQVLASRSVFVHQRQASLTDDATQFEHLPVERTPVNESTPVNEDVSLSIGRVAGGSTSASSTLPETGPFEPAGNDDVTTTRPSTCANVAAGAAIADVRHTRIMPADLTEYARVSGDDNPIHLHDAAARALGFPSVIAQGLLVLARAIRLLPCASLGRPEKEDSQVSPHHARERLLACETKFVAPLVVPKDGVDLEVRIVDESPLERSGCVYSLRVRSNEVEILADTKVTVGA